MYLVCLCVYNIELAVAKNSLAAEFKSSAEHQEVMKQVDLIADDHRSSQDTKKGKAYHYSTSFPWQVCKNTIL